MKKFIITAICLFASLGFTELNAQISTKQAPNFAKVDASPMDLIVLRDANKAVAARVIYSRPQKRDREIFGKLVPYGKVWRTGANEATELTLYQPMMVAGKKIDAGTYTLFTIPNEKEWTVILNKKVHTWGAYEYSEEEDLVRINVPTRQSDISIEAFSMAFEKEKETKEANLLIGWDTQYVKIPFETIK